MGKKSCPSFFLLQGSSEFSPKLAPSSLTYIPTAYHTLLLETHIKPSIVIIDGFALSPLLVSELKPVGIICVLESLLGLAWCLRLVVLQQCWLSWDAMPQASLGTQDLSASLVWEGLKSCFYRSKSYTSDEADRLAFNSLPAS